METSSPVMTAQEAPKLHEQSELFDELDLLSGLPADSNNFFACPRVSEGPENVQLLTELAVSASVDRRAATHEAQ